MLVWEEKWGVWLSGWGQSTLSVLPISPFILLLYVVEQFYTKLKSTEKEIITEKITVWSGEVGGAEGDQFQGEEDPQHVIQREAVLFKTTPCPFVHSFIFYSMCVY